MSNAAMQCIGQTKIQPSPKMSMAQSVDTDVPTYVGLTLASKSKSTKVEVDF